MQLSFASIRIRELCEDPERVGRDLPTVVLESLQDRLAEILAATCWAELQFGAPTIDTRPPGAVRWQLGAGYELVCTGGDPAPRLLADGSIDQNRLRRVKVEQIGEVG